MKQFDIPILLEFYARPEKFLKVFDSVKAMKPAILFLYQDAPKSENDKAGWAKCREIVNSIDWPCDIHTYYQEQNKGCDPSGFLAQSWFFDNVEFGIVLEDDCVPNCSFFYFCREMLIKYKDDNSIAFISGMNVLDKFRNPKCPEADYFFTAHGGIWGWATWKRFYMLCDPTYSWLNNKNDIKAIKDNFYSKREGNSFIKLAKARQKEKKEYFETIVYSNARLHNQVEIVPCVNLISNIGIGELGTHGPGSIEKLPPRIRKLFFKETFEIPNLITHPILKERNYKYEAKIKPSIFDGIMFKIYSLRYYLTAKRRDKGIRQDNLEK